MHRLSPSAITLPYSIMPIRAYHKPRRPCPTPCPRFPKLMLLIFILFLSFLSINHYAITDDAWSTADTFGNHSCDHRVNVNYPDGTTESVQRCYPLLINFAHGCCRKAQRENCRTGLAHGIRQCLPMNKSLFDHDPQFVAKNKHILDRKRGAGYWLWKPYLVSRELALAAEGDIIIYSDAAVHVIADVEHLIKLTQHQDVITFEQDWKEYVWTKRDTLIIMGVDHPSFFNSSAGVASYLVVRKSAMSMAFVSEWLGYAQDSRALTDDGNVLGLPNYKGYREHRHDQSILGLLAKKRNLMIYPDPSQWGEGGVRPYPTVFFHHRGHN